MAGDFLDPNSYIFGFQIHHIFPSELYSDPEIAASVGASIVEAA